MVVNSFRLQVTHSNLVISHSSFQVKRIYDDFDCFMSSLKWHQHIINSFELFI